MFFIRVFLKKKTNPSSTLELKNLVFKSGHLRNKRFCDQLLNLYNWGRLRGIKVQQIRVFLKGKVATLRRNAV